MKMFLHLRNFFVVVFFVITIIGFPRFVSAGTMGLSPPVFSQEVVKGEVFKGVFNLQRPNPSTNDRITVTTTGDLKDAVQLNEGMSFVLPTGKGTFPVLFSIESSKLESGHTYEGDIQFVKENSKEEEAGNAVKMGVAGKIVLRIVDKLTAPKEVLDLSEEKTVPETVHPVDVWVTADKQTHNGDIHIKLQNTAKVSVINVPYSIDIFLNKQNISHNGSIVFDEIESGENKEIISPFSFSSIGKYRINVRIGEKEINTFYKTSKPWFGLGWFVLNPLIPVGVLLVVLFSGGVFFLYRQTKQYQQTQKKVRERDKRIMLIFVGIGSVIAIGQLLIIVFHIPYFIKTIFSDVAVNNDFVLVVRANKENDLIRLNDGLSQTMSGAWNFFRSPAFGRVYAFPTSETTEKEYNNRFFLFGYDKINYFDYSKLPGGVERIEDNANEMYLLIVGKREESSETYYCLTELNIKNGPDCRFLDEMIHEPILNVTMKPNQTHEALIVTKTKTYVYDFWTERITTTGQNMSLQTQSIETPSDLFAKKPESIRFGFVNLQGKNIWIGFNKKFIQVSDSFSLLLEPSAKSIRVYLINTTSLKKTVLTTISQWDHVFLFKKGMFLTTP